MLVLIAGISWLHVAVGHADGPSGDRFTGATPEQSAFIRSEKGQELIKPDIQEALSLRGASLQGVHAHRFEKDGSLVHTRFPVAPPATQPRRLAVGRWTSKRQLIRDLKDLSVIAYTTNDPYNEETMSPIIAAKESLYGPGITTYSQELAAEKEAMDSATSRINGLGNVSRQDGGLGIDATGLDSIGVHALEFNVTDVGVVLAFRGSYSVGDFDNIKPWIAAWILGRMNSQLKDQWINIAGLTWTEEMESDTAKVDRHSRIATSGGIWYQSSNFKKTLTDLAKAKGLDDTTVERVAQTGYWEFTKIIAESVRSSINGEELYITGHSQGGARAALVSMYFEKKYGSKYETITFAATGGACFARDLSYTSADLTADVDPYISHSQITDYVHALDIYGFFDRDVGTTCVYGKSGIAESKAAKYCASVFGHSGPNLMVAGTSGLNMDLSYEFARCRYFTHSWYAVNLDIDSDTFIKADGSTDGGCTAMDAIPKDDPENICPSHAAPTGEGCRSAKSCSVCEASVSSVVGFGCYWCDADEECRSYSETLFYGCSSNWLEKCNNSALASGQVRALGSGGLYIIIAMLSISIADAF